MRTTNASQPANATKPWLILLVVSAIIGCKRDAPAPPQAPTSGIQPDQTAIETNIRFENVTSQLKVDFVPTNGEERKHFSILETIGVGIAWLDYDNDSQLDLFIPGGGSFDSRPSPTGKPGGLLQNQDGQFRNTSQAAGAQNAPYYSHAAIRGDYNNDGFCDMLVTGYGGMCLFCNMGDGTFEEVASHVGLENPAWSTGAAWGDINGDGNLDLFVTNYVSWSFENHPACYLEKQTVCSPIQFTAQPDIAFLSSGNGTFEATDMSAVSSGKGLAVMAADYDRDGDIDFYVANDTTPNALLENNSGELRDIALESGVAFGDAASSDGSMGIDVGDYNLDGQPDLWVANYEGQSFALYRGLDSLLFRHESASTRISAVGGLYVGFGTAFVDLDGDGDEDLLCTTGHVTDASPNSPLEQQPLLFENAAGKAFTNVASQAGPYMASKHVGRGLALADYDGDGAVDAAISHNNAPTAVLRNVSNRQGNWLALRLVGRSSNRDAIGASLTITSSDQPTQLRLVKSGSSYISSHEGRIFFGLGGKQMVDVNVLWPAGERTLLENVQCNQTLLLIEP